MIYLISKIILSLLAALGIGFGMAWMLQMHLAARLREQLNSVIFETKSRIPALESEITNRDQTIDGLREELASKPKDEQASKKQSGSKEQEKQIDQLRQQVIDLENELRMARGVTDEDSVFELPEGEQTETEEVDLMSDDEFLADIQDIFEDTDDSIEAFGSSSEKSDSTDGGAEAPTQKTTTEQTKQSIEEELQNELDGWDDGSDDDLASNASPPSERREHTVAERPKEADLPAAKPPLRAGPVDLKAELLDLEDQIRTGSDSADEAAQSQDNSDIELLRGEVESLAEARKALNEIVDSQSREMAGLQQQRELQDKSLTVLNQQLELARMANERILRELRELKDGKPPKGDSSQSATAG